MAGITLTGTKPQRIARVETSDDRPDWIEGATGLNKQKATKNLTIKREGGDELEMCHKVAYYLVAKFIRRTLKGKTVTEAVAWLEDETLDLTRLGGHISVTRRGSHHMAKKQPRYTAEFRLQMVELHRRGRRFDELSKEFGVTSWSIRQWVKQAARDAGQGDGGLTSTEREELSRLRRENRVLQEERDILSKAAAWFAQENVGTPKKRSDS